MDDEFWWRKDNQGSDGYDTERWFTLMAGDTETTICMQTLSGEGRVYLEITHESGVLYPSHCYKEMDVLISITLYESDGEWDNLTVAKKALLNKVPELFLRLKELRDDIDKQLWRA